MVTPPFIFRKFLEKFPFMAPLGDMQDRACKMMALSAYHFDVYCIKGE